MFLRYMSVFFLSMVPLLELRGAIPIAVGLGIEPVHAVIVCAIGNLVPVPFIYFFARKFLVWGLDKKYIGGICHFFHDKGQRAGKKLSGKAVIRAKDKNVDLCGWVKIYGDGTLIFDSQQMSQGARPISFSLDISAYRQIRIEEYQDYRKLNSTTFVWCAPYLVDLYLS